MKILVTGGAGFIGSHLVDRLLTEGHQVIVVDNLSTGSRQNLNFQARFYELDVNEGQLASIFEKEKPEIVYHLAFNVNVPLSVRDPLFDARSLTGSLNVFLNCVKHNVKKVVMASSAFIYGNSEELPFREDSPFQPISPYAISKMTAENYLRFFREAYGLPFVILRYATVYGPRQVGGAMADYIRKIMAGERAEMYGDGNLTRDYVYVADVVEATLAALRVPDDHPCPIYNIGSAQAVSLNRVYALIAKLLEQPDNRPVYLPSRPGELLRYAVSSEKAQQELGWQFKVGLEEGIKRILKQKKLISLVMAVRNERGGLAEIVAEMNQLPYPLELIFVEGGSTDGTYEELRRLAGLPWQYQLKVLRQDGIGKKDAVAKGLKNAQGELVFVYDADGEIAVAELPRFFETLLANPNLFLTGTRFRLPMQKKMPRLNKLGNKFFAILMSFLVGSRLSDPLCGLKGANRKNYWQMIVAGFFNNDLDRFAEFDQLFGAKRLGLTIRELPVVYRERCYGETKVHRFRVGWQLLKRIGAEILAR